MKIASFNINSVKARLPIFLEWIKNEKPDIICLQEIKCENQNFPTIEIEDMGYNAAIFGQKTYNGVAILSRHPIEDKQEGLPHFTHPLEPQSRYLEALITPKNKPALRVACVYAPNGNPVYDEAGKETEKYQYKLAFHKALTARAKTLLAYEEILIFAGDYNIIPSPQDAYNIKLWEDDALYRLPSRQAFREMLYLGFTDALQARPAPSDTDNNFTDNNSTDNNSTDNNSTDSNSTNSNSTNSNSTNNNFHRQTIS